MVVTLKHIGTTILLREVLMSMKTSANWSAHPLSTLPGMLSGPAAFHWLILWRVSSSHQSWLDTGPGHWEEGWSSLPSHHSVPWTKRRSRLVHLRGRDHCHRWGCTVDGDGLDVLLHAPQVSASLEVAVDSPGLSVLCLSDGPGQLPLLFFGQPCCLLWRQSLETSLAHAPLQSSTACWLEREVMVFKMVTSSMHLLIQLVTDIPPSQ